MFLNFHVQKALKLGSYPAPTPSFVGYWLQICHDVELPPNDICLDLSFH